MSHEPVMLAEMLGALAPKEGETYIDGTFGAGGYSKAILKAANCRVFAIDRDPSTKQFAMPLEQEFPGRFVWLLGNFSDMCSLVAMHGVTQAQGIVLDLGVSSMQFDQPQRGFSFRHDAPLDMRMEHEGVSAADIVNEAGEQAIADILYYYGEEKAARRIARAIVNARGIAPIKTTHQLATIVRDTIGQKPGASDSATRSFQALRIHVNQEFDAIQKGLEAASQMIAPGGRLVVVSFHSLEDRIVKNFYHSRCGRVGEPSRHEPLLRREAPSFLLPKPEKLKPTEAEAARNPRARSATLRTMVRKSVPTAEYAP